MKCAVLRCPNEGTIKYNDATWCEICYTTVKFLETSEYQLGDK